MSAHDVIPVKLDDFRNTLIRCVSVLLLQCLPPAFVPRPLGHAPSSRSVHARVCGVMNGEQTGRNDHLCADRARAVPVQWRSLRQAQ